jgi:hypothetical protein
MKKKIGMLSLIFSSVLALPFLVFAAAPTNFKELVNNIFINGILKPLVPALIGLAVVVFIYGILIVMFSEGGEKKESGKMYMLWGIIGIFVMVSVWGLVSILKDTFGLDTTVPTITITVPGK